MSDTPANARFQAKGYAMHVYNAGFAFLLLLLFVTATPCGASAQQAEVQLQPGEIRLGEHARMTVELAIPAKGELIWPSPNDIFPDDIELIRTEKPDTLSIDADTIHIQKSYVITSWDDGYYPIPPAIFRHVADQDTTVYESRAVLLQVEDVEVDLEEDIKEIRPIIGIPLTFWDVFLWIGAGVLLAIVFYIILRWWKRRRNKKAEMPVTRQQEDVPAHIAAISSLETLRRKKLWQDGRVKEHYMELTDIIRLYMSKRFGFAAQEMTTGQILQVIPAWMDDPDNKQMLAEILYKADLVKFAKHQPASDEHEAAIEQALSFVSRTIPAVNNKKDS